MNNPGKDSRWRVLESRRMIEDARALVSIAEGLRDPNPDRDPDDAADLRSVSHAPGRAVLVHAVSIDDGDLEPRTLPILVLLDDAPAVPEFLPEGADVDLANPTEEGVRRAIELRVREALNRAPAEHTSWTSSNRSRTP